MLQIYLGDCTTTRIGKHILASDMKHEVHEALFSWHPFAWREEHVRKVRFTSQEAAHFGAYTPGGFV